MAAVSMFDDLFRYNDWAHHRLLALCEGLTDEQLDRRRELGFGSLRATLFHIMTAEQIWWERWAGIPWRQFPFDPQGTPLAEIAQGLADVAQQRRDLIEADRGTGWQRVVEYRDSKGNPYENVLSDLLLHVANHGIHHRAQALSFLKDYGRTVPAGLDYIFYRLAMPVVAQDAEATAAMRSYGLQVAEGAGAQVAWEPERIRDYFAYHDWANRQVLDAASPLDAAALDRQFGMGPGSIRHTLLHLHDAEQWWRQNWSGDAAPFPRSAPDTTLDKLAASWSDVRRQRLNMLDQLDTAGAMRVVQVRPGGGPPTRFQVIESLIQLCGHGTHHRAQLLNMLKHSGIEPPALDYIIWVRLGKPQL